MPKEDLRVYYGMRLSEKRNVADTNHRGGPLTSRSKRTCLPSTTDRRMALWLPGGQLTLLLLLLLLQVQQTPAGSTEAAPKVDVDLTPDSFDDQYQGCSKQMVEELNQGDYFMKEIDTHKYYSRAWQKAHLTWLNQAKSLPEGMTTVHAVAILVFSLNLNVSSDLAKAMTRAARSPGQYSQSFHFKYLHYYLTSAIQLLRKDSSTKHGSLCYKVHHRMKDGNIDASVGSTIRFGQFLSASLLEEETQASGNHTLFTIFTCLGASVQDFTLRKEVLIPPYELFEVISKNYTSKGHLINLWSAGNMSAYDCQLLKGCGTGNGGILKTKPGRNGYKSDGQRDPAETSKPCGSSHSTRSFQMSPDEKPSNNTPEQRRDTNSEIQRETC
ncbi:ecto-ADP-ribosyltransferase 4-like isoform X3 [Apodemus sylvaticus]|uniref:ecto-ADP-ribosyltransferase 4-like isoform X3 n=1 Tax=Apodemus sylvaticus TaxID=10129 RepID=UPI00224358C3|nr:ecto-ADP-ribosyltransferase 4-like isoform X3 [Apodemus sylvaticus]